MSAYIGKTLDGEAPLTYDQYLKVPQLLSLQECRSNPAHHDEMLFILIHQTYELWFRLILHELDSAITALNQDNLIRAEQQLHRVVEIQRILVPQIHILETMSPIDFLEFRNRLKPASGFQSAQFREVEFTTGLKDQKVLSIFKSEPDAYQRLQKRLDAPTLSDAFYSLLARRGYAVTTQPARDNETAHKAWCDETVKALLPIYQEPAKYIDLYRLAERMIEIDEYISLWRYHHVRMVERMVGFKIGTGGSEGVGYLTKTLTMKSFPELWQLRTHIEEQSS